MLWAPHTNFAFVEFNQFNSYSNRSQFSEFSRLFQFVDSENIIVSHLIYFNLSVDSGFWNLDLRFFIFYYFQSKNISKDSDTVWECGMICCQTEKSYIRKSGRRCAGSLDIYSADLLKAGSRSPKWNLRWFGRLSLRNFSVFVWVSNFECFPFLKKFRI